MQTQSVTSLSDPPNQIFAILLAPTLIAPYCCCKVDGLPLATVTVAAAANVAAAPVAAAPVAAAPVAAATVAAAHVAAD